ncbi:hypothetical protein HanRHA438_Chr10g0453021 [Helianthus annuus]|nr:hypothetical protein HanRHA438_Chr10g0453021 [Helianthus annuus]
MREEERERVVVGPTLFQQITIFSFVFFRACLAKLIIVKKDFWKRTFGKSTF